MIIIPRIARKDLNTPFLHVMVQGINKEYIFENDYLIERYLEILNKNKENYNFTLIAYCIMTNHAHFLIYTEDIIGLSRFMHKTNLLYSRVYNTFKNRVGVIFRNKYKVEPIYDLNYLLNCIVYIHNNPVNAGMVKSCENYKYSSYNDFINNTGATQSKIMNSLFGKKCNYLNLFKKLDKIRFMDVSENNSSEIVRQYISNGIHKFLKLYSKDLVDILSNKIIFKKLLLYLKQKYRIKNIELQKFFNVSKYVFK